MNISTLWVFVTEIVTNNSFQILAMSKETTTNEKSNNMQQCRKSACPTCGAKHDEVIKRLRGTIYTEVSPIEHDQLIARMKRQRCSYNDILQQHHYTKVELNPVPGTDGPFYCQVCLPGAIANRKNELKKLDETKRQLGLF